jgi:integrase
LFRTVPCRIIFFVTRLSPETLMGEVPTMPKRNSKYLTEPGIKKMARAPKGKRIERFDSGADGLCLRITDRGSKTWCISYHFPDEDGELKHYRFTIGPWPAIGIAEARDQARLIKSQARARIDPKAVREAAWEMERAEAKTKTRKTFRAIAENYIAFEVPGLKRGSESESLIRKILIPEWGDRQASKIEPGDLTEITDRLQKDGKPAAARHAYEIATRVFNWAQGRGDIGASPFAAMRPPVKKVPRGRALKEHEIKALWPVLTEMAYPFGPLQQLLLLLGQRRSEVAEMQWSEVDANKRTWTIPAARSKNDSEHIVPLPDAAVNILNSLPRFSEGDFVFTTTAGARPVSGFSKAKTRTDQILAKHKTAIDGWRVHDLRRTCRTGMARLGVPEIVSERVLNHLPQGLGKIYNLHEYLPEKAAALARWAQEVANIVEPPPENVVKLKAKR